MIGVDPPADRSEDRPSHGPGFAAGWRECTGAFALLLAIGLIAFGGHILHRGFYYDDWANLALFQIEGDGLRGAYRDAFDLVAYRPAFALYAPLPWAIFDLRMALHLGWALVLSVVVGTLIYRLLGELGMPRWQAGAAAALGILFPYSDSTRLWASASPVYVNVGLFLCGLLLALRGLRASERREQVLWHAGAAVLYAASVFFSEVTVPLVIGATAVYWWQSGLRRALPRAAIDWPIAIAAALYIAGNTKIPESRGSSAQLDHARDIADQMLTILARSVVPIDPQRRDTILAGLVAVVAASAFVAWRLPRSDPARNALVRALVLAAGALAAAAATYAVYVPADPYYVPLQAGIGNRVNAVPALALAVVVVCVASMLATLALRGTRGSALAIPVAGVAMCVAVAIVYTDLVHEDAGHWNRAFDLQEVVLGGLTNALPNPPAGSMIYSFGHSGYEDPGIPIFAASWDLNGAVKIVFDDPSLTALPVAEGVHIECGDEGLHPAGPGYGGAAATPYGTAVLFDAATARAEIIDDRAECLAQRDSFVPGPIDAP